MVVLLPSCHCLLVLWLLVSILFCLLPFWLLLLLLPSLFTSTMVVVTYFVYCVMVSIIVVTYFPTLGVGLLPTPESP